MLKKKYSCDICKAEIRELNESFGLHFKNNTEFTLGGYGCTEGTHICYRCAKQLHDHLINPEIKSYYIQGD